VRYDTFGSRSSKPARRIGGSLPLQYAIVVSSTALIAVLIMQTAGYKVAAKLNAVTSTLSKL
jgi:hypothetical protein